MTQPIRWLHDEIAVRMLQKLDIVKLDAKDILLIPDFSGKHRSLLTRRFPNARIHSIIEGGMSGLDLLIARIKSHWRALIFPGKVFHIGAYLKTGKFNLPDNSVDLILSDLLLQDLADPKHFLQECWRVLKEGGLISFSYLGPDTGKELRPLEIENLRLKTLLSPWDMHDMGDALVGERFSDPVMDMEYLTIEYEKPALLMADINGLKLAHSTPSETSEMADLPQKLTLEVVYGHAWAIGKHLAKAKDQVAYIDINQIGRKTRPDSA
ncbi:methyltransferase domain-containing protein [Polynucleobacter necessarius]|uniref:methyltransferase domain-containing protein n=1 Tax=Polynucleobacter necessarius TaxID=576610 RepID=UPI000E0945BE|nr:methyltransferase domain-containing protein [Polynucleobacter necessarius]